MRVQFKLVGPDRYCPHCKRLLVKIHDDGTFDLSGHAALESKQTMTIRPDEEEPEVESSSLEATCLYMKCQLKEMIGSAIRA
jgi:hypothetical protein